MSESPVSEPSRAMWLCFSTEAIVVDVLGEELS